MVLKLHSTVLQWTVSPLYRQDIETVIHFDRPATQVNILVILLILFFVVCGVMVISFVASGVTSLCVPNCN